MENVKHANAMKEVLEYLKGIREEDLKKIPENFLDFLNINASEDYQCNFDYSKPLSELKMSSEAKSIIGMIYYNFWCETEQQKRDFLELLDDNEKQYQEELRKKYNIDKIFENKKDIKKEIDNSEKSLVIEDKVKREKWYMKIYKTFKKIFGRK